MRKMNVILLMLATVLSINQGCRKKAVSPEAPVPSHEERKIQEDLMRVSDWRSYLEISRSHKNFANHIGQNINRISDPVCRMKYFKRFDEIAFAFPLDATEPDTRGWQFNAFCNLSRMVALCACKRNDLDSFWMVNIRRLRRINDEIKRLDAYFDGRGEKETFKGNCDIWKGYRRRVEGEFSNCDKQYTHTFGVTHTADFLTYDRWQSMRSQLEEILGHKVNIWSDVLKLMEEKRKKEQAQNTK